MIVILMIYIGNMSLSTYLFIMIVQVLSLQYLFKNLQSDIRSIVNHLFKDSVTFNQLTDKFKYT